MKWVPTKTATVFKEAFGRKIRITKNKQKESCFIQFCPFKSTRSFIQIKRYRVRKVILHPQLCVDLVNYKVFSNLWSFMGFLMSLGAPPVWQTPPRWGRGLCEGRCQIHWQFYTAHLQRILVCTGSSRICMAHRPAGWRHCSSRLGFAWLRPSYFLLRDPVGLIRVETEVYLGRVFACASSDMFPRYRCGCINHRSRVCRAWLCEWTDEPPGWLRLHNHGYSGDTYTACPCCADADETVG